MTYSSFKKLHPVYIFGSGLTIMLLSIAGFFVKPLSGDNSFPSLLAFYIDKPWVGIPLGFLAVISTAYLMLVVLNRHEIFKPKTFLPFLVFGVIIGLYPANLYLNSLMLSNLFFIAALNKLMFLPTSRAHMSHVLEASFFLGIASLFFWPAVFSMPIVLLATLINGLLNGRSFLLWIIGYFLPWAMAWAISYLADTSFGISFPWKSPDLSLFLENKVALSTLIYCLVAGVLGLFFYFTSLEKTTVEIRNQKRIVGISCFVWLLSAYSAFLTEVDSAMFFVMLAPIMAFLISTFLYHAKWKPLVFTFILFSLGTLIYNYSQLMLS